MRRVRYRVAASLDGYIAGPDGELDWIVNDPSVDLTDVAVLVNRGCRLCSEHGSLGGARRQATQLNRGAVRQTIMTDEKRYVHCGTHGQVQPAFACGHLVEQLLQQRFSFIGWFEAEVDPDRRQWGDLNGWCKACDDVLLEEGEWNDRSEGFARIKMICEHCFARIRDVQRELDTTEHFKS